MNNTEIFIEKARAVHGDKYDYSKVEYINNKTKVCVICPEHGEFWVRPDKHTSLKSGCPKCGKTYKPTTEEFIRASKAIFGDKYDYSKTVYVNEKTKICLIDKATGVEFWQSPKSHLQGNVGIIFSKHKKLTNGDFIEKAKKIHGDKYDYSKVKYKDCYSKVCIICHKHGEFWQAPYSHLYGKGCPKCSTSKLEKEVIELLESNNIEYVYQGSFDWLRHKNKLSIDFFLPNNNIVIECQGRQHFREEKFFDAGDGYNGLVTRDKLKKKLCNEHGIRVLYFSHYVHDYWDKVYHNKEELLKEIKNGTNELCTTIE